jgi:integrase
MDELQRLVAVSGPRGVVYHMAAFTGLRRGELLQLEWRDLHPTAERPFVNVRASISKNYKQAMLPLHSDLVKALGNMETTDRLPKDLVFRRPIPRMDLFRKDLEAAGISYVDEKGEFADFHALRKTFGTMLTLAGVPQRVVMELMRHSDMRPVPPKKSLGEATIFLQGLQNTPSIAFDFDRSHPFLRSRALKPTKTN